ncbi:TcaA 3rd/4th domain-containing protein [Fictibacillus enclensis]|uniref:TcaA 3rd/4th domain-containing protein n=1 Tax=Fictibacillus enclensis TaxID=1017270 RepID=UPI0024BFBA19|nr:hypothetical protein [Fictibacillus enclensis]WHY71254.1 hypothetical protein QNH15_19910 [Fictibacillus enclensis]
METEKAPKRGKKISLILLSLFLVGMIAVIIFNFTRPSGDELVNKFEAGVNQGDIDSLKDIVKSKDGVTITDDNLKQLTAYAKDEPDYLKVQVFLMKAQTAIEEKDEEAKSRNPLFERATEGEILKAGDYYITKKGGLFSSYHIYPRPYSLTVSSDQPGSTIKLNNKKVLETKKDNLETTVRNLAPGTYSVQGSKKYDYAEIQSKDEVNLFEDEKFSKEVSLELTGEKIPIVANVEGVSIFVNGKDTGKKATIQEEGGPFGSSGEEEESYGPFSTDGSVEIYGESKYPWGVAKSEPETVTEDTGSIDVTPSPFVNDEVRDQIVKTINDFAKQQLEALVKQDASVIKTATDNIVKEHAEDIQSDKSYDNYWKGKAIGTRIDIDKATLANKEDEFQIEVPVEFHYKFKEYNKGWDDEDPLEEEFNTDTVILTYNDESKSWLISEINSSYFGDDEMKGKNVIKTKF